MYIDNIENIENIENRMTTNMEKLPMDIVQYIGKFFHVHERKGIRVSFGDELMKLLKYPLDECPKRISYYHRPRLMIQEPGYRFRSITSNYPTDWFFYRRPEMCVQFYLELITIDKYHSSFDGQNQYYYVALYIYSYWNDSLCSELHDQLGLLTRGFPSILNVNAIDIHINRERIELSWNTLSEDFNTLSKSLILLRSSLFLKNICQTIQNIKSKEIK